MALYPTRSRVRPGYPVIAQNPRDPAQQKTRYTGAGVPPAAADAYYNRAKRFNTLLYRPNDTLSAAERVEVYGAPRSTAAPLRTKQQVVADIAARNPVLSVAASKAILNKYQTPGTVASGLGVPQMFASTPTLDEQQVTNPNVPAALSASTPAGIAGPIGTTASTESVTNPMLPGDASATEPPFEPFMPVDDEAFAQSGVEGPPGPSLREQMISENARHADFLASHGAHAEAMANLQPGEALPPHPEEQQEQPVAAPIATKPWVPEHTAAFTGDFGAGFGKEPLTLKGVGGGPTWTPSAKAPVAFNEGFNSTRDTWVPHSSMEGPYKTAGRPAGGAWASDSTQNFYDRAAARANAGSKNDLRRVNRLQWRVGYNPNRS